MNPKCVAEVSAAIGRALTKAEESLFEGDLTGALRELARRDPAAWRQMTGEQRLNAAAEFAATEAVAAADKTAQRKAGNLVAQTRETARLQRRAAELALRGTKTPMHDALFERFRQADDYIAGVRNESMSGLIDAIEAVSPKFFGMFDDAEKVREFARAVMDGNASTPEMGRAAKAYIDTLEQMRQRSNAAGTDIGQLDYGYLPQPHDVGRVAKVGPEAWAEAVMPKLRRDRYIRADGQPMDDAEVLSLLHGAWETIATEGRNKMIPGAQRGGTRASRFDDKHRAIHFKDADAYLDYLADFGRGSMMQSIHGHVGQMSKGIGLMEEFGGNPQATYRLLKGLAEKGDNKAGARNSFATLDMVWDTLNGTTAQPVDAQLAQFWQGVRNFVTATKLQGVMLSAVTDAPLQVIVARSAGVPMGDALKSLVAGVGMRDVAHEIGIGLDEVSGEMARWHQDHLAQGWTSKMANTTMRLTLVEAWTNALRRGYALTLSGTLERMRATNWDALAKGDRLRFESQGITEADWAVWQQAQPQMVNGKAILSKEGIRAIEGLSDEAKNRSVARLLGFLDQEAKTAVLAPDLMTRAAIQQGTKAGTWGGEMLRSFMLFKSFAIGVMDKHIRRVRNIPTGQGKAAYGVAMMTSLTMFGAMSLQLKDIIAGKDPRDMTTGKFWLAAFMQGGGIGIFGDLMYTGMGGNARGGQANWTGLAGPVFGTAFDLADLTLGNAYRAAQGKETDFGADALRFASSNTPFIRLWYIRAAIDHLFLHDLQEQLSPGYLRRMKQRARKDWDGQQYFWEPGQATPERAPNPEAALGEK